MRSRAAAFQNQPEMWLSIASLNSFSFPIRETSTGVGTLPLRKPGILTLEARSEAACSTAWCTSAPGTSTVSRTLLSGSSSTCVAIKPLDQTLPGLRLVVRAGSIREGQSSRRHGQAAPPLTRHPQAGAGPGWGLRSLPPVELYIIARHGESTLNFENRINGDPDVPVALTAKGREEAILLGQQLKHAPIDVCVHTRFLRTR